ncbi:MAG: glycosyltransferase family 1 protein [Polyangiaceae bacterium]|nr:glycosyltransferase family 1 protein [Polyangiaceae bacterium]MBK8938397.1 glycosyltransferase family 1 protein [Polyangiaceae bacterium]
MRYIASAFGSAGDFLPTLAVARALARDGHEVSFVTNPFHEHTVRAAGLDYRAAGEHVHLYRMIAADPGLLTSPRVVQVMAEDLARPHFAVTYQLVSQMLRAERVDAVIGSNLAFGLHWAAIARGVPSVMIAATPLHWLTRHAPVQFLDFELPASLLPTVMGATRSIGIALLDHALRSVARTAGATTIDPSYSAVEAKVALHAGMWPALMRPPSRGDLPNMRACGFVRAGHLGTSAPDLSPDLDAFLAAGEPPVVIALGSIFSLSSDALVADAADACADLGRRCVLVGPAPRERALPEGTCVVPYATYHELFPRAAAIVTHGGAGTTGEALKSGRPAVVLPLAFDQFGISWQVERLGAGVRVPKRGRSREGIASALSRALTDEAVATRASHIAAELRAEPDGADLTARLITELR